MTQALRYALVAALGASVVSCQSRPISYEDCILQKVKPGLSTEAVQLVTNACRDKFPLPPLPARDTARYLTTGELALLSGRAGETFPGSASFSGSIHNGNREITVTELTIAVASVTGGTRNRKLYHTHVQFGIRPLETGTFRFSIIEGEQGSRYEWDIVAARGIPGDQLLGY